jgi:serine/threonine-protein kinase HipA
MNLIQVKLWGMLVGVLVWDSKTRETAFQYSDEFISKNLQVSPLVHPLSRRVVRVDKDGDSDGIDFDSFKGLPLFISDSLPDAFGSSLFAQYLEKEGKLFQNLNPLEQLSYIGADGMGALEFVPAQSKSDTQEQEVSRLSQTSRSVLNKQSISNGEDLVCLFNAGASLGGSSPKVLINIDPQTGVIFRGDQMPTKGHEAWILKFNRRIGLPSDLDMGKVEYAYFLIARNAGIHMMDSHLKEIDGVHCFLTKRFDRQQGTKLHTQTLHAIAGMDFTNENTYSYEQVFSVINALNLGYPQKEQLFRRMVFNFMGRNTDDHTKNFGFYMNAEGEWTLSPAYDLTFSYSEYQNIETPHFLSINGKNTKVGLTDILILAKEYSIKNPKAIINQINQSFLQWEDIADQLMISQYTREWVRIYLKTIPYQIK